MKLDSTSSQRLALLRFPLIVGVVFIHAYGTTVGLADGSIGLLASGGFSAFFRELISQGVARVAVPLFFLISGYFFFLKFKWTIINYQNKLLSRIKTLLMPFLFWNIITLLFLAIAQAIPATKVYFSGNFLFVGSFGVYDYFNAIFGIDRAPVAYQFWFIRDLMFLVLSVPLIQLLLNLIPRFTFLLFFLLWFSKYWPLYVPDIEAVVFFYAGAYFANREKSLFYLDAYGKVVVIAYIIILIIDVLTKGNYFNEYIHRTGILLGVIGSLYLTKYILNYEILKKVLLWASGTSFFVFAVHEPILTVLKKVLYTVLLPKTDFMVLMLYFLVPSAVIILSMSAYIGMRRYFPNLLNFAIGGR